MTASSRALAATAPQELSSALFRLMAESWPYPVLLLDRDLRVRWANPLAASWLDTPSREALIGRAWTDLSLPWSVDAVGLRDALAGKTSHLPEATRVTATRERRLCRARLQPLQESSGGAGAILCVIDDLSLAADTTAGMPALTVAPTGAPVTDTQRQLALSSAQVGAFHWDFDSGYYAVDSRWCKTMHVDPCSGLEHLERWSREIHPDDVAEFRRRRAEIEAGHTDRFEVEYRVLTGDSRWLWVLQRGRTVEHRPDGRAARVTGICIDIDDRKRAEVTLQENESRLATALWGARAAFWQWHLPTDTTTMSPLWFAMTGYSREQWESLSDPWRARVHPEDHPHLAEQVRRHLAGEAQSLEAEYRIRTVGGEYKWILMRGRVVEWDFDGKPVSAIGVSLDIDAQKRAEVELLSSEARLETAVWGGGLGLWELDFRTERTRWFGDWCDRLDIDPCDGSDHVARWDSNLHPDDVGEAARRFADHVAGKEDYYDAEYRIRTRKGEWRWLFERGRVVEREADGRALRMVGVCMDIDARKAAELGAGRNQRRLEAALESARGGMWDWDIAADTVHFTDYFYRMLGYSPTEGHERRGLWSARTHPEDRERVALALAPALEGRAERHEVEYRIQHADGSWRWVLDSGRVTEVDSQGRALRMVGFLVDVTDRRTAEEALRSSAAVLRAVTDNTPDWLFLLDESFIVRFLNRGFSRYRVEDVLGRSLIEMAPAPHRTAIGDICRRVFASGEPARFEFHCQAPNDGTTYYQLRVVPVLDDSRTRMITVAVTEVTERVVAEQALLRDVSERKRLEREIIEIANREQQRIGSDLHDGVGQDLTGIALMLRGIGAQLRKEGSSARLDVEDVINLVNNAIESTRALARGLSPVSAEQGGLAAALQALAARAGERYGVRVGLRTDFMAPLQLPENTATHLYRIAQEAITNIVRHSRATAATLELRADPRVIELTIADNGRGFDVPTDEATGLGLKIMRYRAQMLGGDLVLESLPEGGARVRCTCPVRPSEPLAGTGRARREDA